MTTIRLYTAMLLLTAGLVAGSAQAGGPILGNPDSFSLLRTDLPQNPPPKPVTITMVHDDQTKKWTVSEADIQKAAKYTWKVDARCQFRLQSLKVEYPGGTETYQQELKNHPDHLQKEKVFPSFDSALLRQRCLDVATGSTQSGNTNDEKQEISSAHAQFVKSQPAITWVNGAAHANHLLLSGTCSTKDGSKTLSSVSGKEYSTEIKVNCCVENTPACELP